MNNTQQLHWEAVKLKDSGIWLLFIKVEESILSVEFHGEANLLEVRCLQATYKAHDLPDEVAEEIKRGSFSVTVKSDSKKSFYDVPVSLFED